MATFTTGDYYFGDSINFTTVNGWWTVGSGPKRRKTGEKLTEEELMVARKIQHKGTIEATREQWAIVMEEHRLAASREPAPANKQFELDRKQMGLKLALQKNIKVLNGEPLYLIASSDGYWFDSYGYRTTVLNAKQEASGDFRLTVQIFPPEQEDWREERIETVMLYQVWQVRAVHIAPLEVMQDAKFMHIVDRLNRERNKQVINLESQSRQYQSSIQSMERDIAKYKKNIIDIEAKVKTIRIPDLGKEDVLKLFNELGKNKKVANAYLTSDGKMVVETRMLYGTSPVKLIENKKKPIGRIAMELSVNGISQCRFTNLDFCYHSRGGASHYPHPNISGTQICGGNNLSQMDNMVKSGSFYELVDFLILFFSLFPHDSGGPHVDHETWMASRRPEKKENPFRKEERFWELRPAKTEPAKPPAKSGKSKAGTNPLDGLATFAGGPERARPAGAHRAVAAEELRRRIMENMQIGSAIPEEFLNEAINDVDIRMEAINPDNIRWEDTQGERINVPAPGNLAMDEADITAHGGAGGGNGAHGRATVNGEEMTMQDAFEMVRERMARSAGEREE